MRKNSQSSSGSPTMDHHRRPAAYLNSTLMKPSYTQANIQNQTNLFAATEETSSSREEREVRQLNDFYEAKQTRIYEQQKLQGRIMNMDREAHLGCFTADTLKSQQNLQSFSQEQESLLARQNNFDPSKYFGDPNNSAFSSNSKPSVSLGHGRPNELQDSEGIFGVPRSRIEGKNHPTSHSQATLNQYLQSFGGYLKDRGYQAAENQEEKGSDHNEEMLGQYQTRIQETDQEDKETLRRYQSKYKSSQLKSHLHQAKVEKIFSQCDLEPSQKKTVKASEIADNHSKNQPNYHQRDTEDPQRLQQTKPNQGHFSSMIPNSWSSTGIYRQDKSGKSQAFSGSTTKEVPQQSQADLTADIQSSFRNVGTKLRNLRYGAGAENQLPGMSATSQTGTPYSRSGVGFGRQNIQTRRSPLVQANKADSTFQQTANAQSSRASQSNNPDQSNMAHFFESHSKYIPLRSFNLLYASPYADKAENFVQSDKSQDAKPQASVIKKWFQQLSLSEKSVALTTIDKDLVNLFKAMYKINNAEGPDGGGGEFLAKLDRCESSRQVDGYKKVGQFQLLHRRQDLRTIVSSYVGRQRQAANTMIEAVRIVSINQPNDAITLNVEFFSNSQFFFEMMKLIDDQFMIREYKQTRTVSQKVQGSLFVGVTASQNENSNIGELRHSTSRTAKEKPYFLMKDDQRQLFPASFSARGGTSDNSKDLQMPGYAGIGRGFDHSEGHSLKNNANHVTLAQCLVYVFEKALNVQFAAYMDNLAQQAQTFFLIKKDLQAGIFSEDLKIADYWQKQTKSQREKLLSPLNDICSDLLKVFRETKSHLNHIEERESETEELDLQDSDLSCSSPKIDDDDHKNQLLYDKSVDLLKKLKRDNNQKMIQTLPTEYTECYGQTITSSFGKQRRSRRDRKDQSSLSGTTGTLSSEVSSDKLAQNYRKDSSNIYEYNAKQLQGEYGGVEDLELGFGSRANKLEDYQINDSSENDFDEKSADDTTFSNSHDLQKSKFFKQPAKVKEKKKNIKINVTPNNHPQQSKNDFSTSIEEQFSDSESQQKAARNDLFDERRPESILFKHKQEIRTYGLKANNSFQECLQFVKILSMSKPLEYVINEPESASNIIQAYAEPPSNLFSQTESKSNSCGKKKKGKPNNSNQTSNDQSNSGENVKLFGNLTTWQRTDMRCASKVHLMTYFLDHLHKECLNHIYQDLLEPSDQSVQTNEKAQSNNKEQQACAKSEQTNQANSNSGNPKTNTSQKVQENAPNVSGGTNKKKNKKKSKNKKKKNNAASQNVQNAQSTSQQNQDEVVITSDDVQNQPDQKQTIFEKQVAKKEKLSDTEDQGYEMQTLNKKEDDGENLEEKFQLNEKEIGLGELNTNSQDQLFMHQLATTINQQAGSLVKEDFKDEIEAKMIQEETKPIDNSTSEDRPCIKGDVQSEDASQDSFTEKWARIEKVAQEQDSQLAAIKDRYERIETADQMLEYGVRWPEIMEATGLGTEEKSDQSEALSSEVSDSETQQPTTTSSLFAQVKKSNRQSTSMKTGSKADRLRVLERNSKAFDVQDFPLTNSQSVEESKQITLDELIAQAQRGGNQASENEDLSDGDQFQITAPGINAPFMLSKNPKNENLGRIFEERKGLLSNQVHLDKYPNESLAEISDQIHKEFYDEESLVSQLDHNQDERRAQIQQVFEWQTFQERSTKLNNRSRQYVTDICGYSNHTSDDSSLDNTFLSDPKLIYDKTEKDYLEEQSEHHRKKWQQCPPPPTWIGNAGTGLSQSIEARTRRDICTLSSLDANIDQLKKQVKEKSAQKIDPDLKTNKDLTGEKVSKNCEEEQNKVDQIVLLLTKQEANKDAKPKSEVDTSATQQNTSQTKSQQKSSVKRRNKKKNKNNQQKTAQNVTTVPSQASNENQKKSAEVTNVLQKSLVVPVKNLQTTTPLQEQDFDVEEILLNDEPAEAESSRPLPAKVNTFFEDETDKVDKISEQAQLEALTNLENQAETKRDESKQVLETCQAKSSQPQQPLSKAQKAKASKKQKKLLQQQQMEQKALESKAKLVVPSEKNQPKSDNKPSNVSEVVQSKNAEKAFTPAKSHKSSVSNLSGAANLPQNLGPLHYTPFATGMKRSETSSTHKFQADLSDRVAIPKRGTSLSSFGRKEAEHSNILQELDSLFPEKSKNSPCNSQNNFKIRSSTISKERVPWGKAGFTTSSKLVGQMNSSQVSNGDLNEIQSQKPKKRAQDELLISSRSKSPSNQPILNIEREMDSQLTLPNLRTQTDLKSPKQQTPIKTQEINQNPAASQQQVKLNKKSLKKQKKALQLASQNLEKIDKVNPNKGVPSNNVQQVSEKQEAIKSTQPFQTAERKQQSFVEDQFVEMEAPKRKDRMRKEVSQSRENSKSKPVSQKQDPIQIQTNSLKDQKGAGKVKYTEKQNLQPPKSISTSNPPLFQKKQPSKQIENVQAPPPAQQISTTQTKSANFSSFGQMLEASFGAKAVSATPVAPGIIQSGNLQQKPKDSKDNLKKETEPEKKKFDQKQANFSMGFEQSVRDSKAEFFVKKGDSSQPRNINKNSSKQFQPVSTESDPKKQQKKQTSIQGFGCMVTPNRQQNSRASYLTQDGTWQMKDQFLLANSQTFYQQAPPPIVFGNPQNQQQTLANHVQSQFQTHNNSVIIGKTNTYASRKVQTQSFGIQNQGQQVTQVSQTSQYKQKSSKKSDDQTTLLNRGVQFGGSKSNANFEQTIQISRGQQVSQVNNANVTVNLNIMPQVPPPVQQIQTTFMPNLQAGNPLLTPQFLQQPLQTQPIQQINSEQTPGNQSNTALFQNQQTINLPANLNVNDNFFQQYMASLLQAQQQQQKQNQDLGGLNAMTQNPAFIYPQAAQLLNPLAPQQIFGQMPGVLLTPNGFMPAPQFAPIMQPNQTTLLGSQQPQTPLMPQPINPASQPTIGSNTSSLLLNTTLDNNVQGKEIEKVKQKQSEVETTTSETTVIEDAKSEDQKDQLLLDQQVANETTDQQLKQSQLAIKVELSQDSAQPSSKSVPQKTESVTSDHKQQSPSSQQVKSSDPASENLQQQADQSTEESKKEDNTSLINKSLNSMLESQAVPSVNPLNQQQPQLNQSQQPQQQFQHIQHPFFFVPPNGNRQQFQLGQQNHPLWPQGFGDQGQQQIQRQLQLQQQSAQGQSSLLQTNQQKTHQNLTEQTRNGLQAPNPLFLPQMPIPPQFHQTSTNFGPFNKPYGPPDQTSFNQGHLPSYNQVPNQGNSQIQQSYMPQQLSQQSIFEVKSLIQDLKQMNNIQFVDQRNWLTSENQQNLQTWEAKFYQLVGRQIQQMQAQIEAKLKVSAPQRSEVFDRLLSLAQNTYSAAKERIEFKMYGSMATGLAIDSSDMDIQIDGVLSDKDLMQSANPMELAVENMDLIFDKLQKLDWIDQSQLLDKATVPVIKLVINLQKLDKNQSSQEGISKDSEDDNEEGQSEKEDKFLKIDLIFNDVLRAKRLQEPSSGQILPEEADLQSTQRCAVFIKQKVAEEPFLKPLAIVFKKFLALKNLNSPFQGTMSSYGLVLMILALLNDLKKQLTNFQNPIDMQHAVQQSMNLHSRFSGPPTVKIDEAQLQTNLGMAFAHFLNVFGDGFNTAKFCIDENCEFAQAQDNQNQSNQNSFTSFFTIPQTGLQVFDPIDPKNNVGKQTYNFALVQDNFNMTRQLLVDQFQDFTDLKHKVGEFQRLSFLLESAKTSKQDVKEKVAKNKDEKLLTEIVIPEGSNQQQFFDESEVAQILKSRSKNQLKLDKASLDSELSAVQVQSVENESRLLAQVIFIDCQTLKTIKQEKVEEKTRLASLSRENGNGWVEPYHRLCLSIDHQNQRNLFSQLMQLGSNTGGGNQRAQQNFGGENLRNNFLTQNPQNARYMNFADPSMYYIDEPHFDAVNRADQSQNEHHQFSNFGYNQHYQQRDGVDHNNSGHQHHRNSNYHCGNRGGSSYHRKQQRPHNNNSYHSNNNNGYREQNGDFQTDSNSQQYANSNQQQQIYHNQGYQGSNNNMFGQQTMRYGYQNQQNHRQNNHYAQKSSYGAGGQHHGSQFSGHQQSNNHYQGGHQRVSHSQSETYLEGSEKATNQFLIQQNQNFSNNQGKFAQFQGKPTPMTSDREKDLENFSRSVQTFQQLATKGKGDLNKEEEGFDGKRKQSSDQTGEGDSNDKSQSNVTKK